MLHALRKLLAIVIIWYIWLYWTCTLMLVHIFAYCIFLWWYDYMHFRNPSFWGFCVCISSCNFWLDVHPCIERTKWSWQQLIISSNVSFCLIALYYMHNIGHTYRCSLKQIHTLDMLILYELCWQFNNLTWTRESMSNKAIQCTCAGSLLKCVISDCNKLCTAALCI